MEGALDSHTELGARQALSEAVRPCQPSMGHCFGGLHTVLHYCRV